MSLIIAISTRDGIILAADSRVGIASPRCIDRDKCIAYYDHGQKLCPFEHIPVALAFSGSSDANSGDLRGTVVALVQSFSTPFVSVSSLSVQLQQRLKVVLPRSTFSLLLGGYEGAIPIISYVGNNPDRVYPISKKCGFLCQYEVDELGEDDKFEGMSLASAIVYAESFINAYAKREDYWRGIGGETNVLIVEPRGCKWYSRNSAELDLTKKGSELAYYRAGSLRVNLFEGHTEQELIDALSRL